MIFSHEKIKESIAAGTIAIVPLDLALFKGASYSLTLDLGEDESVTLAPGEFLIRTTIEKLTLSENVACLISTRGSVAQMGIDVSQSSVFCEPDTDNVITLEISNHNSQPVTLNQGMPIAKAVFVAVL